MTRAPPEIREHAERRARYLVEAYEVDESAREAFVSDLVLELCSIWEAAIAAFDTVQAANGGVIAGQAANRQARRALQKNLRR